MPPIITCMQRFRPWMVLGCWLSVSALIAAPTPEEARRHQALLDLTNDYVVMCVAAHPDDEDGQTLTYLRKKLGVETIVVVASRGEGGQNEIGPELYKDLGVIRTHEMDAVSGINGAQYFNLNNIDFGFSKSGEEAKERWGWDQGLYNLVSLIRHYKPHIIITHHDKVSGHGHHQLTGQWVEAAFDLATDKTYKTRDVLTGWDFQQNPWQVARLYVRTRNPGNMARAVISTPVGEVDPFWKESYASIAQRGLAQHRSQGMDKIRRDGLQGNIATHYELVRSATDVPIPRESLLDGIPNTLPLDYQQIMNKNEQEQMQLLSGNRFYSSYRDNKHWSDLFEELKRVRAAWYNLRLSCQSSKSRLTHGEEIAIQAQVSINLDGFKKIFVNLAAGKLKADGWNVIGPAQVEITKPGVVEFRLKAPNHGPYTVPKSDYYYNYFSNLPNSPVGVMVYTFPDGEITTYTGVDFDFVPPTELRITSDLVMATLDGSPIPVVITLINNIPEPLMRDLYVLLPDGWRIENSPLKPILLPARDTVAVSFSLLQPATISNGDSKIIIGFSEDQHDAAQTTLTVRKIDVAVAPGLTVGVVKSYDNTLEQTLEQLGVSYTLLEESDLASGDLSRFDTIILDIRAYLVRQDLVRHNRRMLEYVYNGGHVICMYNKTFEWNQPESADNYAPYPIRLGRDRVTRETAPVRILLPGHPLFRYPNAITDADWDGWVQERGLYFPESAADAYVRLLSSQDPTEPPLRDGHLIAQYGKGTYLYTSYVWYRQMKVLIPGGIRNFANMLSLPKAAAAGFAMP